MLSDVCLFGASEIKQDATTQRYCFPVYNIETGLLWYTACCSNDMYQKHFAQLENRPHHLFFAAKVVDVPMLMDMVGPVAEARQRLDLVDCTVLPSDVHVPQGFVNRATPTTIPYTFEPGPKAGYYLIKMTGEARFVPESIEEHPLEPFDDEEDIDFGPDDFEEVAGPSLSVFDADLQSTQDVPPPQSTARTSVPLRALNRRSSRPQAQASTSSESSQQPSISTSAGKKAGKQRAVSGVATTSTPQQPQQSRSSSTQQTQQSGSGTATTISSGSEPDYLGLYHMFEEPATEKPTFSSRLTAASTSGFVGVAATGEIQELATEGSEETDDEEGEGEGSAGMLKRTRTTESQSTITSRQLNKRSKTAILLERLRKKSKQ